MSYHDDVREFHEKFNLPHDRDGSLPRLLDNDTFEYRRRFLIEELTEMCDAHDEGNLAEFADALVDLIYIACGTAHLAGINLDAHFAEVQRTNMQKERATSAADPRSKRGHALDVVKPAGWVGPDHEPILRAAGWKG
jgi:predicted HAD superfamily Cof-like phosphohydrolase